MKKAMAGTMAAFIAISALAMRAFGAVNTPVAELKTLGAKAADALLVRMARYPGRDLQMNDVFGAYGLIRFADAAGDKELLEKAKALVEPYRSGAKFVPCGHIENNDLSILSSELFVITGDKSYLPLIVRGADDLLREPRKDGLYRHARMWPEDCYLIGAPLARAYAATGNREYIDFAAGNLAIYMKQLQQEDGSLQFVDNDAGGAGQLASRDNGDALGAIALAEVLRVLPGEHALRGELLKAYMKLVDKYKNGGEKAESITAGLICYSMIMGLKDGFLAGAEYENAAHTLWNALQKRVDVKGRVQESHPYLSGQILHGQITPDCSIPGNGAFLMACAGMIEKAGNVKESDIPKANPAAGVRYVEPKTAAEPKVVPGDPGRRIGDIGKDMKVPDNDTNFRVEDMVEIAGVFAGADKAGLDKGAEILKRYIPELQRADGFFNQGSNASAMPISQSSGMAARAISSFLAAMPKDHPLRPWLMRPYKKLAMMLERTQDGKGFWHQSPDDWNTAQDATATAQFCYALATGLENGWLTRREYREMLELGMTAIGAAKGHDGGFAESLASAQKAAASFAKSPAFSAPEDLKADLGPLNDIYATQYNEQASDGRHIQHVSTHGMVDFRVIHADPFDSVTSAWTTEKIIASAGKIPPSQQKPYPCGGVSIWVKENPSIHTTSDDVGFWELPMAYAVFKSNPGRKITIMGQVPGQQPLEGPGLKTPIAQFLTSPYEDKSAGLPQGPSDYNGRHKLCGELLLYQRRERKELRAMVGTTPEVVMLADAKELRPVYLRGQVVSATDGKAVNEASVWLKRNPSIINRSNPAGEFEVMMKEAVLYLPERDSVMVTAPGYEPLEVRISSYLNDKVAITMKPAARPPEINSDGIAMIKAPAGFFRNGRGMMAAHRQKGSISDFDVRHVWPIQTVAMPSFYIGKYRVDPSMTAEVYGWAVKHGYECAYIDLFAYPLFCNALSERGGFRPCYYTSDGKVLRASTEMTENLVCDVRADGYRLPTFAEVEYVYHANRTTFWWWGDDMDRFFDFNVNRHFKEEGMELAVPYPEGFSVSFPRGKRSPNDWGIYESAAGNVDQDAMEDKQFFLADEFYNPRGPNNRQSLFIGKEGFGCQFFLGVMLGNGAIDEADGTEALLGWPYMPKGKLLPINHYGPQQYFVGLGRAYVLANRVVRSAGNTCPTAELLKKTHDPFRNLPAPADRKTITADLQLVDIPGGQFVMGAPVYANPPPNALEAVHLSYPSVPNREVKIASFKMSRFEITLEQWNKVGQWAAANGYSDLPDGNMKDGGVREAQHPASGIKWHDALKWCNAASEMNHLAPCYYADAAKKEVYRAGIVKEPVVKWDANGYRLPTEAEWEYASLGGMNDAFNFWGNHAWRYDYGWTGPSRIRRISSSANFDWGYQGQTDPVCHPVGMRPANQYGLYDILGNVWEWCWDWAGPYEMAAAKLENPRGPDSLEAVKDFIAQRDAKKGGDKKSKGNVIDNVGDRCLRGYAYDSPFTRKCTYGLRTRASVKPETAAPNIGFRVAAGGG